MSSQIKYTTDILKCGEIIYTFNSKIENFNSDA